MILFSETGEKLVNNRLNWSFGTFILTSDMWKQSEGWKGTFKYGLFLTYYLVEYVHISVEFLHRIVLELNLVINAFFLYCKLFMYLKISDIISFVKLDKSRCISLLLCFWHINCPILMVIYPNNYSNFRTIMEVIMKNKWLLCILLMLFLPFGLFAQVAPPLEKQKTETQEAPENNNEVTTNSDTNTDGDAGKTIKGVINDEQGETIIGASVIIKGEDTGTTSDMDGRFTLEAPEGAILVISYIGYHTQEVKVRKRSLLRVVLKEDNQLLDEVVVVGYGTVKKSDLTGAVSGVSNRQYKNQPVQRVENILQGRTPGVEVTATSGMPGASMKVRVRGTTSINKSSDPLYVIDGIISSSGLDGINPSDIQSMEILKDASSTAIYGSRGSNGVILITTKQGSEGKAQVTFDASSGFRLSENSMTC